MNSINGGSAESLGSMYNATSMDAMSSASRMGGAWSAQSQPSQKMTELAQQLGVSTTDLQAAFRAAWQQVNASAASTSTSATPTVSTSSVSATSSSTTSSSTTSSTASTASSTASPFLTALSEQLGVSTSTVQNAFNAVGIGKSGHGGHHHHHHGGGGGASASASSGVDAAAQQLGVQPQDLENALLSAIDSLTSNPTSQASGGSQVLNAVAKQLGVSTSGLQQALQNSNSVVNTRA